MQNKTIYSLKLVYFQHVQGLRFAQNFYQFYWRRRSSDKMCFTKSGLGNYFALLRVSIFGQRELQ